MSRYVGPSCRLCRREGTKLFLKGTKCLTEKCPVERRAYPPGQHGQTGGRPRKASEYAKQMREKQKVKRMYGLTERQFRNTFDGVTREPGVKGTNLLVALESRLDNIVYRMGFASQPQGGAPAHRATGTSKSTAAGWTSPPTGSPRARKCAWRRPAASSSPSSWRRRPPRAASRCRWLSVDTDKAAGRMTERPTRDAIPINAQEQLIVELYSK